MPKHPDIRLMSFIQGSEKNSVLQDALAIGDRVIKFLCCRRRFYAKREGKHPFTPIIAFQRFGLETQLLITAHLALVKFLTKVFDIQTFLVTIQGQAPIPRGLPATGQRGGGCDKLASETFTQCDRPRLISDCAGA